MLVLLAYCFILFVSNSDTSVPRHQLGDDGSPSQHQLLDSVFSAENTLKRLEDARVFYAKANDVTLTPWPSLARLEQSDRIAAQLRYVPPGYSGDGSSSSSLSTTTKLIAYPLDEQTVRSATSRLASENCPVQRCVFSANRSDIMRADAVILKGQFNLASLAVLRRPRQIWIMYQLESPFHSNDFSQIADVFNWTATYRRDSVLVTPYEKFVPFSNYTRLPPSISVFNYAQNKTKLVAWFVSNCNAKNGRGNYVEELAKYINVDIYGSCGKMSCPRSDQNCFKMLSKNYKFYLSFENSNCKDYITEKLYVNAYQ